MGVGRVRVAALSRGRRGHASGREVRAEGAADVVVPARPQGAEAVAVVTSLVSCAELPGSATVGIVLGAARPTVVGRLGADA